MVLLGDELTLNMREICAAVYGRVMSSSNSREPLMKAICVTCRSAIWYCRRWVGLVAAVSTMSKNNSVCGEQLQQNNLYSLALHGPGRKNASDPLHTLRVILFTLSQQKLTGPHRKNASDPLRTLRVILSLFLSGNLPDPIVKMRVILFTPCE